MVSIRSPYTPKTAQNTPENRRRAPIPPGPVIMGQKGAFVCEGSGVGSLKKVWTYRRKGRAGVYVGWYELGRRCAKSLPTKELADHFSKVKYQQLNSGVFTGLLDISFDRLKEDYLYSFRVRQLTQEAEYQARLTLDHFERICGALPSRRITQGIVDHFIVQRAADRTRQPKTEAQTISRHTLNKDISNLRAFLNFCKTKRCVTQDIEIKKIAAGSKVIKPLSEKQVAALLGAVSDKPTWYIRVLLSLTTGLRKNDVENLTLADIDLENCSIDTKSKKTRKAMPGRPLPASLVPLLKKYIGSLPAEQTRLFADTNTHKKWKLIRESAGLADLRYQDLRVTFSSVLQQAGTSLAVVQQLLEHSSPETTRRFYTNVDKALRRAVDTLPVDNWLE